MMDRFLAAVGFLTILPLPGRTGTDEQALAGSLWFSPIVGLLIGALAASAAWLLGAILPLPVVAVLLVLILLAASGGLHMDGLADTADGFFSARPRERILAIMRDSRVGAMGVMAIVLTLALKIAALASFPIENLWIPALLMPLAGRCVLVLLTAIQPYARSEGGLATPFYAGAAKPSAAWALTVFTVTAWLVAGPAGLVAMAGVMVGSLLFTVHCKHKIGGATGDTLGAACELAETLTALLLLAQPALPHLGGICR